MEVSLVEHTKNPEEVIANVAGVCYNRTPKDPQRTVESLVERGHESTFEHATFRFLIEGISRCASRQLLRHRIASYMELSQRYVDKEDFEYVIPETIRENAEALEVFESSMKTLKNAYKKLREMKIPKEDARYVLPEATTTRLYMTVNLRSILNFLKLRLSKHAQWEIRSLAGKFLELLNPLVPTVLRRFYEKG